MCTKHPTESIIKLTSEEFINQLETLLKSAPENMVYLVNAMEDPESGRDQFRRQVIALSGSCNKLSFAFKNAFDKDHRFEHVVGHAVEYSRFMKSDRSDFFSNQSGFPLSGDAFKSMLDRLFRK